MTYSLPADGFTSNSNDESHQAQEIFAGWGENGLSYMGLREANGVHLSPDRRACVAYIAKLGVGLVLGGPVGPTESAVSLVDSFGEMVRGRGLRPAFCGVLDRDRRMMLSRGYRLLSIGDEAVVDPDKFSLEGGMWREVRIALNRARHRGLSFRWLEPKQRGGRFASNVRSLSEEWLSRKRLPELGYAFGDIDCIRDAGVRVGGVWDGCDQLRGMISWVPVPAKGGWMMELLRYRPGFMPGLADYLVASSVLSFRDEGCRYASLSGSPLAHMTSPQSVGRGLLMRLVSPARRVYDYEGMRHFKSKFNPRWNAVYLAYRGFGGLAVTLVALASAFGVRPRTLLSSSILTRS